MGPESAKGPPLLSESFQQKGNKYFFLGASVKAVNLIA